MWRKTLLASTLSKYSVELELFDTFLGCWNYNTQMHLWRYVFTGEYVRDRVVMDIACGVGYGTRYIAERGAKIVFGVDLDSGSLGFANSSYNLHNIQYVQGNGIQLPFKDESVDVAVSFETIEHIPIKHQEAFVAEIHRMLRPQGAFICSSLNHKYSPGHVDHTREFLPDELFGMIGCHFGQVQEYGQYISAKDLAFQRSQTRRIGFQLTRKRNILLHRVRNWFRADQSRIVLRDLIKRVLHRKNDHAPPRDPVYMTESLISGLDPQYMPVPLSCGNGGVLFDPVAVCYK
jgi:ubiquinone/menaquinone biosynthesis C-methylase UbiE